MPKKGKEGDKISPWKVHRDGIMKPVEVKMVVKGTESFI